MASSTTPTLPKGTKVLKLVDGRWPMYKEFNRGMASPHGSNLSWDLPQGDKPGKWMVQAGAPRLCLNGLHAFYQPSYLGRMPYQSEGKRIFRVELAGKVSRRTSGAGGNDSDKLCAHACRLLYEIHPGHPEWAALERAKLGQGYMPVLTPTSEAKHLAKLTADIKQATSKLAQAESDRDDAIDYLKDALRALGVKKL